MQRKRMFAITIASFIVLQNSCPVFAGTNHNDILDSYSVCDSKKIDLSSLTDQQLNEIISDVRKICENGNKDRNLLRSYKVGNKNVLTYNIVEMAWLAAAQVAKNNGFPLAGSLVESSVNGYPFRTFNGYFGSLVMSSDAWKNYYNMLVSNNMEQSGEHDSLVFERYDNADLFFGLHIADVHCRRFPYTDRDYDVNIHDVFNFEYDDKYDNIFVGLVNDWAWLCQQIDALKPIPVDIDFHTSAY